MLACRAIHEEAFLNGLGDSDRIGNHPKKRTEQRLSDSDEFGGLENRN